MQDLREFITSKHPYDQMSAEAIDHLMLHVVARSYSEGEPIYRIGDQMHGLYIVRRGQVEVRDAQGQVISVLGAGNSFGERGLMADGDAVTSAGACMDAEIILLPASEFSRLMKEDRFFAAFFDRRRQSPGSKSSKSDFALQSIRELMSQPVQCIDIIADVQEAAKQMGSYRISCLMVMDQGRLQGLITLRDLVYKSLAENTQDQKISQIMTNEPITINVNAMAMDAMLLMAKHRIGHLPVMDDDELVGVITRSDLIKRGANTVMAVVLDISRAHSAKDMKTPIGSLPRILAQLAGAGVDGHIVMRLITDIADAATRRLIALYTATHGAAPGDFVWGACGSQGRQEQTGVSDQDNCIIYSDDVVDATWFHGLAKFVSDGLDEIGYFYCPGDMMATNPMWCVPIGKWREYFANWIAKPTGEAQMLASVMFDLRAIDGNPSLLDDLRDQAQNAASKNSIFQAYLIGNSLGHQPPLSLFRGISTIASGEHKNTIDLKHNGVVPIADLARIYGIQGNIPAVNTRARIEGAITVGVLSQMGGQDLITAYDFISEMRLRHQSRQIRAGQPPDNYLDPSSLSELERSHLRDAFVVVKSMQSAIARKSVQ